MSWEEQIRDSSDIQELSTGFSSFFIIHVPSATNIAAHLCASNPTES